MFRYSEHVYQFPIHHQRARPLRRCLKHHTLNWRQEPPHHHHTSYSSFEQFRFPPSVPIPTLPRVPSAFSRKKAEWKEEREKTRTGLVLLDSSNDPDNILKKTEEGRCERCRERMPATLTFPATTHPHLANSQKCQRSIWRQFHRILALPHFFCLLPVFPRCFPPFSIFTTYHSLLIAGFFRAFHAVCSATKEDDMAML